MTNRIKTAKRAGIYVRVSSEEQVEGYSLDAQTRAIETLCHHQGWEIVARYADEGKSARSDSIAKRPDFRRMLDDADAGRFDILVVHKMDRFARNIRVALDCFGRLGAASVRFVSVSEQTDWDTPAGRLQRNMLLSVSEWYSDNLSVETRKGKQERKAQGLPNGLLPFGVTKGQDGVPLLDTTPRPHPTEPDRQVVPAEGLRQMFELAATGKTDREIAQVLTADGYRTSGNRGANPFTKDTVRVILTNRFYVGELPDGQGGSIPGKHGALIEPTLFERAQRAREANAKRPRRVAGKRAPWALSGVAICGSCGRPINADGKRRARCSGRTQGNGCDEPSFYESIVEAQIGDLLSAFSIPKLEQARLVAAIERLQTQDRSIDAERGRLRRRLERLRDLYLDGELDRAAYDRQRGEALDRLALLPDEGPDLDVVAKRLTRFLSDVGSAWTTATPPERNKLARQLFGTVVVTNRTAVAVVPRPELRPYFAVNPMVESCYGGSDGDRFRGCILPGYAVLWQSPPARRLSGSSRRAKPLGSRLHKLTVEDEAAILARRHWRSLRELALEFGVSHQTIRSVLLRARS